MKALILAAGLLLPLTAYAKDEPKCKPLADVQKSILGGVKDAVFTKLTKGQYRFAEGLWAMDPHAPEDFPDGDGATLVSSKKNGNLLLWTKGDLVCVVEQTVVPLKLFKVIKDGPGDDL